MTIHFVYSVPLQRPGYGMGRVRRGYEKLSARIPTLPVWYRKGWLPALQSPLSAPGSITWNVYRHLAHYAPTLLYDWQERGNIEFGPDDIIIGHPHPDNDTVIQRAFTSTRKCRAKILMFPIHHAVTGINEFTIPLMERADSILGIMAEYWYDTIDRSFFAPFKQKITRVDMAVDTTHYPRVKRHFNPPGKRGYLNIGSNRPEKGLNVLNDTMQELADYRCAWIGPGAELSYVPRLYEHAQLTPDLMSTLSQQYDFFVNTSLSDPNPTTILEAMAWGLPVACTPESGYYQMPSIIPLSTTDICFNVKALTELQFAPQERLMKLADTNRHLVETHYTWERFCDTGVANSCPILLDRATAFCSRHRYSLLI
jgi:glycosyltransferase involved in cell wall biosynthesis